MALLDVYDLHTAYGATVALRGVSFKVNPGQVVSLVGAKGAGKSTVVNTVSGLLFPFQGRILFDEKNVTGWRADRVAAQGLILIGDGGQDTAAMTVLQNLMIGSYRRSDNAAIYADLDDIFQRFPGLEQRRHQKAGSLSSGEQQLLAIGRGLMAKPRLLMLDEPGRGLDPTAVDEIYRTLVDIRAQGIPILLAEQNARRALQIADYAYVLEGGVVTHQGPGTVLRQNPAIISAYLG
jgi:branched-chain amino acid transport system ATP-binding protein